MRWGGWFKGTKESVLKGVRTLRGGCKSDKQSTNSPTPHTVVDMEVCVLSGALTRVVGVGVSADILLHAAVTAAVAALLGEALLDRPARTQHS